ncbi:hypothetical protein NOR51B_1352 [Luminiphilus syltensis NOR5-1B]|uniref:Uncharacterized protein n=1 Tax=Luminiphilus syltensis NOR5-1B TaxID=565045 RepID=B8KVC2_9GAMM|nr:hypothetical protein NOR51B_1352 [Luminiphilus syltensis NOR5-1B]
MSAAMTTAIPRETSAPMVLRVFMCLLFFYQWFTNNAD